MPFTTPQEVRSSAAVMYDASLELMRLRDNIDAALLLIEHFGQNSNVEAIKELLLKDHGRAPR